MKAEAGVNESNGHVGTSQKRRFSRMKALEIFEKSWQKLGEIAIRFLFFSSICSLQSSTK